MKILKGQNGYCGQYGHGFVSDARPKAGDDERCVEFTSFNGKVGRVPRHHVQPLTPEQMQLAVILHEVDYRISDWARGRFNVGEAPDGVLTRLKRAVKIAEQLRVQDHVKRLEDSIRGRSCPMAVVDYLDRIDGFGRVTEDAPADRRYGTRDMRHVAIYDLKVVSLNPAAEKAAK